MPEGAVYVGRPTKWGNPLELGQRVIWDQTMYFGETPEQCVEFYREWIVWQFTIEEIQEELGGKDLACWCPPGRPCHVDVLLELANK